MNDNMKKQNLSRKKIMNAAILLFANKGFSSTTTREICTQAGVNLSLISYYFKTKDGLYTSIIESIMNYGLEHLQEEIAKSKNVSSMIKGEKIELYRCLLEKYTKFIYSENVPRSFIVLMLKEQTTAHSKFSEMYSKKINLFYTALRKTLASILDKKESDKSIVFEVSSIIGQILSFKIMDRATLSALSQTAYTKEDNKKIVKMVAYHIEESLSKLGINNECCVCS